MKALTIRQPWAWAICHAGKRIENRAWLTSPSLLAVARRLVGQRFAVHAAAWIGTRAEAHDAAEAVIERSDLSRVAFVLAGGRWLPSPDLPRGAVVAVATLAAVVRTLDNGCRIPEGDIVASCMLCRDMIPSSHPCPAADPWAIDGTVGLVLSDVAALPHPVPYKGGQGWWEIPDGAACGGAR